LLYRTSNSASEHGAEGWKKLKVDGAPRGLAESHRLERLGPQPGTDRPFWISLRLSAACHRVIQPNICSVDRVTYHSSSSYTVSNFLERSPPAYLPTTNSPNLLNNPQDEVNSRHLYSGIPILGYNMLTSSNRIPHHLADTNPLLLPEPLCISKPPNINRIPSPPLRHKDPLRSRRRHPELPQVPPLLHLLQRHQAILSRRRRQNMA
jgi:hypothetical protein